jgi:two-component sensor histidine kinase
MHRVKNTLATVQAIATQTLRCAPADERAAFIARLHALSRAHDLLTSDEWNSAPLRAVVDAALEPFQQQRFTLEGPDTWLNASKSLQITLGMHELATNAAKYGALSNAAGRVHLMWEILDADRLKLCWKESGGPAVKPSKQKGFGSILIKRTFAGARLAYAPEGFSCEFEIGL